MVAIELVVLGLTLGAGIVGWFGEKLYQRWKDSSTAQNRTERRVDTLWRYLFGVEDDETDGGLAVEIEEGFNRVEKDIGELRKRQETYHEAEMKQIRHIVNELHDEESLDFDRDDVLEEENH